MACTSPTEETEPRRFKLDLGALAVVDSSGAAEALLELFSPFPTSFDGGFGFSGIAISIVPLGL